MQVDTNIAEADVGASRPAWPRLSPSTPSRPSYSPARSVRSARRRRSSQNVVTYNAVIDVANPELELKPA